jgi:TRAP-type C4-dicarboxylate transport system permease small subunit
MGAGAVVQATGRRKLTELGGLARAMPATLTLYRIGAVSISGAPLLNGFVSKSLIVDAAAGMERHGIELALTVASVGTFLSVGLKLPVLAFGGPRRGDALRRLPRSRYAAMGIAAALSAVVELYLRALPGGFVWAPKMALCLMLWVAFFGASMATYEKAHLALEFGEKIWPRAMRRAVKAFARALTSAFCLGLGWLSLVSIDAHYDSWSVADGFADNVPSMDWLPAWAVFVIFPYVFFAMALRFFAQSYAVATGTEEAAPSRSVREQLPT